MEVRTEVLIIGGGLAGLCSAIHLLKAGKQVLLIEKNQYPQHKVCGEYISNEVLPYLRFLDADPAVLFPTQITRLRVSNILGKHIESPLPLGGFGISRFSLDAYLYHKALAMGCTIIHERVIAVQFIDDGFEVHTSNKTFLAKLVLGAYGKRAHLDRALQRPFIKARSPWLAIKAHYKAEHPSDLVALHNFSGGYCGVSKVENGITNVCYLVNYKSFKRFKSIADHRTAELLRNPHLKNLFENSDLLFEEPMSISQVSFERKEQVRDHILMIGDTAGLIHPLCGNGMSMAIHAAAICGTLVTAYLNGGISTRAELETQYVQQWKTQFSLRIKAGQLLSGIILKPQATDFVMNMLVKFPGMLKPMIRLTHGRPLLM